LLADELGMTRIVVPPLAGNFSAWGLLGADMVQSVARTKVMDFVPANFDQISALFRALFATLDDRSALHAKDAVRTGRLDLRYKGQEHSLSIEVPIVDNGMGQGVDAILPRFVAEYERTFGGTMNEGVELVSVRANTTVPLPRRDLNYKPKRSEGDDTGVMQVWSFAHGARRPFRILPRGMITDQVAGPAIVTEETCTTYVDEGWTITLGAMGELVLERRV
jgi:N-methylhydantoinase A